VEVESVSFFKRANGVEDLAQVRYLKAEHPGGGAAEHVTHWIATVQYAYSAPSKDPKTRRWNPLGFKIVELGSEPEVLTTPRATSDAALAGSMQ
jgi:type IV secretion system protein VirB8